MKFLYTCFLFMLVSATLVAGDLSIYIDCPEDAHADCTDELWDLSGYGSPVVTSSFSYRIEGPHESWHLNDCGIGHISRSWTIYDHYNNPHYCNQTIHVGSAYNHIHIDWPEDYVTEECGADTDPDDLPYGHRRPEVSDAGDCNNIVIGYTDQDFSISGDACKKILRTWKVADWCIYHPRNNPNEGIYQHVQVIKVKSSDPPEITCPADLTIGAGADCDGTYVDLVKATASSTCNQSLSIRNNSRYADSNGADASGFYPLGMHWISFTVTDGCGNSETCKLQLTVRDEKKPLVYCDHGIVTTLGRMSDGYYAKVWPDRFDEGSTDNCTAKEDLEFSITPDFFTCEELGRNKIWFTVEDESGNRQTCETYVIIQDNMGMCPDTVDLTIAGGLSDVFGRSIPDVPVYLNNNRYGMDMSSEMGEYLFEDLIRGEQYSVRPVKRDDIHNGLNIMDMIVLLKHLTENTVIENPYQLFAADVDRNDVVNVLDLYYLRNVLIGLDNKFPSNLSWDFIAALNMEAEYGVDDLMAMSSVLKIDTFRTADRQQIFTGIKLGDLDFNGNNAGVEMRSGMPSVQLIVDEISKNRIKVSFPENMNIEGAQFSLRFNGNDGVQILNTIEEYEGWKMFETENGVQNIQYVDLSGQNDEKLELIIHGGAEAFMNSLVMDSETTPAIAVSAEGVTYSLDLSSEKDVELTAEIYPNPVNDLLSIRFEGKLNYESQPEIIIYDQLGRKVYDRILNMDGKEIKINIEGLASGQYSVLARMDNEIIKTEKFIKM